MKRLLLFVLCICVAFGFSACKKEESVDESRFKIVNGGFETGDLTGWTVESGNAFSEDNVTTKSVFSFEEDENHNQISVNQSGNWHLYGKGFNDDIPNSFTGTLRSQNFILGGTGTVSMKLAGGAIRYEGDNGAEKPVSNRCYVGVYLAANDMMIAKQENEYFLKHTTSYVNPSQYAANVYNTDNYYTYYLDLSAYLGEEMYLRIVDNDTSYYYGYISVDDIRTYSEEGEQTPGSVYEKVKIYETDAAGTEYQIPNGGFETGSLAGWTVTEGLAFSNDCVNASNVWWNENITYNRDGDYHFGYYKPEATGRMRSANFVVGGSGYVSFKLGGCMDQSKTYLRFMLVDGDGALEVARFSNVKYKNFQFPYVANGMKLLNMVQYYADFSPFLDKTMYIEAVDTNTSSDDLGCMVLDSVVTYYESRPVFMYETEAYRLSYDFEYEEESEYQLYNGTFEKGLDGWAVVEGNFSAEENILSDETFWAENIPYNKSGVYFFASTDGQTGVLRSSTFTLGGSGSVSFKLGAAKNPELVYISFYAMADGVPKEIGRFSNDNFNDVGFPSLSQGMQIQNLVEYHFTFAEEYIGCEMYVEIVDCGERDYGFITLDSVITYYESGKMLPGKTATNLL